MTRQAADAIIVPGRGIGDDGSLPPDPLARVRKAVELYRAKAAPRLIMTGKWTFQHPVSSPRTEAAAMKACAASLHVPAASILCEEESMDTIGNAYFVKTKFLEPEGWRNVMVVVSPDHLERARFIFDYILGTDYHISYVESENALSPDELAHSVKQEARINVVIHALLEDTRPGDDASIRQMLDELHPAYSSHPIHSKVELIKNLIKEALQ